MSNCNRTDMAIFVATLAAIALVCLGALVLMELNQETKGETVTYDSGYVDVELPEKSGIAYDKRKYIRSDFLNQTCWGEIGNATIYFGDGTEYRSIAHHVNLVLEVPTQGKAFRYFEAEFDSPDSTYVIDRWDNGFDVDDLGAKQAGYTHGVGRYSIDRGDVRERDTQSFELGFSCLDGDWIEVTYRVGLAEGGVIVEHVCKYTYRFVQPDAPVSDEIRKQSWETGVPV